MLKSKIKDIWIYIEVLLTILLSVSPLLTKNISILLILFLLAIELLTYINKFDNKRFKLDNSIIVITIVFIIAMVFDLRNLTFDATYSMVNFMYPCYFLCGYFIAKNIGKQKFYKVFENIMFIVAILSLIGMSIYYISPNIIRSFPTYYFNDRTHRTIYFFNYIFEDDWMNVRNSGIAWEPGLFMVILNVALNLAIRNSDKKKLFFRVLVYGVAIILTRSTIGYFVFLINILTLIKKDKKYLILVVLLVISLSTLISAEIVYQLEYKLSGSTSFDARFSPMVNAFNSSWYLPFGMGSTKYNEVYEALNLGSFDSWTQILLRFGFLTLFCVLERIFKIYKKDGRTLAIILIMCFFSQPIWGYLLFTVMYYIEEDTLERNENEH